MQPGRLLSPLLFPFLVPLLVFAFALVVDLLLLLVMVLGFAVQHSANRSVHLVRREPFAVPFAAAFPSLAELVIDVLLLGVVVLKGLNLSLTGCFSLPEGIHLVCEPLLIEIEAGLLFDCRSDSWIVLLDLRGGVAQP